MGNKGSWQVMHDVGLRRLAARQAGIATRAQLRSLGIASWHVEEHVRAHRWRKVSRDLVALHTGPLDDAATLWTAVLGAEPPVAIGAWTGLRLHGLQGWERPGTHVVVPRGAKPWRPRGVVVHESRRFAPEDVTVVGDLPVHRVERCAVDAAAWQRSARTAVGLLAAVVQQRLSTPERLWEQLERVGKVRFHRLMRLSLHDIAGGADALSEIDFARLCRARSLPEPRRQERRRDARGRLRFLDAEWTLPGGRRLHVEIDGVGHMEVGRWYDDLMRDAELLPDERTVRLRFPAMAVRAEPERVVDVLARYLT
ncbi:hypothetical protein [Isoptericola variabilis]|uniref:DUF559 domain-containing protein n=1 Tax=Isoptericola variabilis (strain 225) TaxID=743718 RepID=F6FTI1_ISOV2|nr:hypothetical protein [Isoptericola variabilis]AEG43174.1 hypothetical protein Isova_0377 [Isoptericola variabilis 225]TWH35107.1 hypothetical protein L600_000100001110 [Isoptericola variabilis J7]